MKKKISLIDSSIKDVSYEEVKEVFDGAEVELRATPAAATPYIVGGVGGFTIGYLASNHEKCGKDNKQK